MNKVSCALQGLGHTLSPCGAVVSPPPAPGHRCPPARSGHRCVADSSNLYVFGGYNPDYDESGGPENEDYPLFRELWRYNFATDTWHQMGTEGYMPRELASMSLVLHGNNLLVFGGTGIPFGESNGNDVHVCNVKYKRWALLSCRGKKPNRIYGQAMAIINGCLYVFGGTTGYIYSTDLHKLDLNTREWIQLKPNNMSCDMPEERYRHEIAHDGQRIYILGGGTSWTAYSLDKIHAYNLETNTWEEITTKPHEKVGFPAARRCHSCVQIKNGWLHVHPRRGGQHPRKQTDWLPVQNVAGGAQPAGTVLGEAPGMFPSPSNSLQIPAFAPWTDAGTR
uniref:kelch domain-containing protein 10 isoform X1 n=1 Tax=Agelaius phoeniceus TaxID=39638 RepID=UPI0023EC6245|nr:kelch domain-containing protein 10 isoform X1 [Agelaius phoeniceus]